MLKRKRCTKPVVLINLLTYLNTAWMNSLNFISYIFSHMIFFSTGTKVEGILRQAADVEEVDRRVQEYEQGIRLIHINYTLF